MQAFSACFMKFCLALNSYKMFIYLIIYINLTRLFLPQVQLHCPSALEEADSAQQL